MKKSITSFCLTLLCGVAVAQPAGMADAVAALNSATKDKVAWNVSRAKRADVTCDGTADTIMFGSNTKYAWVGVVSGKGGKLQVAKFPISDSENGFCAAPRTISVLPQSCEGDGDRLEGCKEIKSCKQFAVDDGGCDNFHFYWNDKAKKTFWWRL